MFKDLQLVLIQQTDQKGSIRQYFDFVLSGQPLREYLGIKSKSSVTPFGYFENKDEERRILKEFRLQLKPQLAGDRIELYICECCGDIGCGSLTVRVVDKGDKIIWMDFADQSDPDEIGELYDVEEVEFNRQNYFRALSKIK